MSARIKYTKQMIAVRKKRIIQAKLRKKPLTSFDHRLIELERRINRLTREVREYKNRFSEVSMQTDIQIPFKTDLEFFKKVEFLAVQMLVERQEPILVVDS
ncbi:uncharacterized protein LOC122618136 [Drosophila teissieri]|uniref:uncharacterized protein LOC122618136 n=1 Tax=Drosophila teissieri TaxID=7243 RepID=UPI001CBA1DBC|nr:uncharacterized protein LOC122618136 [Drosophila teissieri]